MPRWHCGLLLLALACTVGAGALHSQEEGEAADTLPSGSGQSFQRAPAAIAEESPSLLQRGTWSYPVAIDLPPAPRDLAPALSIVASHLHARGVLGQGWFLQGLSSIERRSPNNGVPSLTAEDGFWLDGQSLTELGALPASNLPRTFRLERDDNRVFQYNPIGDQWVAHRDGWTWRWGQIGAGSGGSSPSTMATERSADSITFAGGGAGPATTSRFGHAVRWHLSRVEDPWGNRIEYRYDAPCPPAPGGASLPASACTTVLTSIAYGSALVELDYAPRPDDFVDARTGVVRRHALRLVGVRSSVVPKVGTPAPFSRYRIGYHAQHSTVLATIERLATDGRSRRLVRTQVNGQPIRFDAPSTLGGFSAVDDWLEARPIEVNFDGDGFPDLFAISSEYSDLVIGYHNLDSGALGFTEDAAMTAMLATAFDQVDKRYEYRVADIDGDGRTELLVPGFLHEWDPVTESFVSRPLPFDVDWKRDSFVDIDGDGYLDQIVSRGTAWIRNRGRWPHFDQPESVLELPHEDSGADNSFTQEVFAIEDPCTSGYPYWWAERPYSGRLGIDLFTGYEDFWNAHSRLADYNGDGIADLAYSFPNCFVWHAELGETRGEGVFSRIYWGDGRGGFHDSDLAAGPSFLENNSPVELEESVPAAGQLQPRDYAWDNWTSWTLADLDADGVREVVHRRDGEARLRAASYRGLRAGWPLEDDDLELPAPIVALSTYVTSGFRPDPCYCRALQSTLVADWDGDGFEDLLVMERGPWLPGIAYDVKIHRNRRANPAGILTAVTNEWGGTIRLSYASSARHGENPQLPFPFRVVRSVTDQRGRSEFAYSGGRFDRGEFHGFAEVEAAYASGLTVESHFSLSPQIRGNLVSRTERRRDGSIERFLYNRYYRLLGSSVFLDIVPPYFNPVRRTCDFEVGPPPSPQSGAPGVERDDLIQQCLQFGLPPAIAPPPAPDSEPALSFEIGEIRRLDEQLYGWRKGLLTAFRDGDELRLASDGPPSRQRSRKTSRTATADDGPLWMSRRSLAPATATARSAATAAPLALLRDLGELLQISLPQPSLQAPHAPGAGVDIRMFVLDRDFDNQQRPILLQDYKNAGVADDDRTVHLHYDAYRAGSIEGQELSGIEHADVRGVYRTYKLTEHPAFGTPGSITELAEDGTGPEWSRTQSYTYTEHGLIRTAVRQVDRDGATVSDRIEYNHCGLPTLAVDAAGRELRMDYNGDCRQTRSLFQGGTVEQARDAFGRVESVRRDNGVSPVEVRRTLFEDDPQRSAKTPWRATIQGDRAEITYADGWGRPFQQETCRLADPDAPAPRKLSGLRCRPEETLHQLRAWAGDGSLLLQTGLFRDGEIPTFRLTFRDERGRTVERFEPSRDYVGPEPHPRFTLSGASDPIATTFEFGVGVTRKHAPNGTTCVEEFDTLSRRTSCGGSLREVQRFDARGLLIETRDALGTRTSYGYDPFLRLARETSHLTVETCAGPVTDPTVELAYDDLDRLLTKRNPDGATFLWQRDALGRLTRSTVEAPDGTRIQLNRWEFDDAPAGGTPRSPAGRSMTSFDANGNRTVQYQDAFGFTYAAATPGGATWAERDAQGRVVRSSDLDGVVTHFAHDLAGNVVREAMAVSTSAADYCGAAASCTVATSHRYDGAGRIVESVDADGVAHRYGYTRAGDPAFETQGDWLVAAFRYDPVGNPLWEWEEGVETTLGYDAWGRVATECRGADGSGCAQQFDYRYTAMDQVEAITVGRRATTTYHYDALGRRIGVTGPDGARRKRTFGLTTPLCAQVDEEGIETRWEHDALGRLTALHPPGRGTPIRYDYKLGIAGSDLGFSGNLSATTIRESDGGIWTTYFDYANRPVAEERPDGTSLRYHHSGSHTDRVTLLDGAGSAVEHIAFGYDELGRQRWEWGPVSPAHYAARNGAPQAGDFVTRHAYTAAGRLVAIDGPTLTAAEGAAPLYATRFEYGADGLLLEESVVGVTRTRYAYDSVHGFPRLLSASSGTTKATPRLTRFGYDASGTFLTLVTTTGPVSGADSPRDQTLETIYRGHDIFGVPTEILTRESAPNGPQTVHKTQLSTDLNGRPVKVYTAIDGEEVGTAYFDYQRNGQLRSAFTDWAGGLLYERQPDGRLRRLRALDEAGTPGDLVAQIDLWDQRGRPVALALAGGAAMELAYDPMGRVTQQTLRTADGRSRNHQNRYDARGLLASETLTTAAAEQVTDFTYTPEGWLASEARQEPRKGARVDSYEYDAAGNRTLHARGDGSQVRMRYGAANGVGPTGSALREVDTGDGWREVEWDAYGGMIRDHRGFGLERNVQGQVARIWDGSGYLVSELWRDHSGRPVKVRSNAGDRIHAWAQSASSVFPLASRDEAGHASVYAAFEQYLVGRVVDGAVEAAATDMRGNLALAGLRLLAGADAFGTAVEPAPAGLPFLFGGQEALPDSPYSSAQQRLYDPELGLFASADPIGLAGGRHRFRYASNDPLSQLDPWGTEAQDYAELELGEPGSGGATLEALVDAAQEAGVEGPSGGWDVVDNHVVDPSTGDRYPIDSIGPAAITTAGGETLQLTAVHFSTPTGDFGVAYFPQSQVAPDAPSEPPGGSSATDLSPVAPGEKALDGPVDMTPPEPPGTGEPAAGPERSGLENPGSGESWDSAPMPQNFHGSSEQLAGLLSDGYSLSDGGALLRSPSGNIVIPGINDAQNPLPGKVLVNLGADAVDDALNGGLAGQAAQGLGLWDGAGSPANDLIGAAGFGYTPSEKPREMIAEVSMGIAVSAVGAPAGGAAANGARATLARGCGGPLGRLPSGVRRAAGITCFVADTLVATATGSKPIQEVQPGELVHCRNDVTGQTEICVVEATYVSENREIVDLVLRDEQGRVEVLGTTPNHRFRVDGERWTEAADLQPGDRLVDLDGRTLEVVDLLDSGGSEPTYNLEVAGNHSYFAGEMAVWVHNGGRSCSGRARALNLKEASSLLGRKVTRWKDVSVGDLKDLKNSGRITQGQLSSTLRGSSRSARNSYIRMMEGVFGKDKIPVRIGDQIWAVPKSQVRNGRKWHMGHYGTTFKDMVFSADRSMSVTDFRASGWAPTLPEWGALNSAKGAALTALDVTH